MDKYGPTFVKSAPINYSKIIQHLNVQNARDLMRETFEVDQHKLECKCGLRLQKESVNYPEDLFTSIGKDTRTYIYLTEKWKIDAPYHKPPLVEIFGYSKGVQKAKQRVEQLLGCTSARVILKLEIPFNIQTALIGLHGSTIKTIKEDSKVKHIFFPNVGTKAIMNNEVTLYGSIQSIERARWLLRQWSPLIVTFLVNQVFDQKTIKFEMEKLIKSYKKKYSIETLLFPKPLNHSLLVMVKGVEKDAAIVKHVTKSFMRFTKKWSTLNEDVQLMISIGENFYNSLKKSSNKVMKNIMENTKTLIRLSESSGESKFSVIINGIMDSAYSAKQQLMGNLPVSIVFFYIDIYSQAKPHYIKQLNIKFDVSITLLLVNDVKYIATINGLEKNMEHIYACRQKLLNDKEIIKPTIPKTYFPILKHDHSKCEKREDHLSRMWTAFEEKDSAGTAESKDDIKVCQQQRFENVHANCAMAKVNLSQKAGVAADTSPKVNLIKNVESKTYNSQHCENVFGADVIPNLCFYKSLENETCKQPFEPVPVADAIPKMTFNDTYSTQIYNQSWKHVMAVSDLSNVQLNENLRNEIFLQCWEPTSMPNENKVVSLQSIEPAPNILVEDIKTPRNQYINQPREHVLETSAMSKMDVNYNFSHRTSIKPREPVFSPMPNENKMCDRHPIDSASNIAFEDKNIPENQYRRYPQSPHSFSLFNLFSKENIFDKIQHLNSYFSDPTARVNLYKEEDLHKPYDIDYSQPFRERFSPLYSVPDIFESLRDSILNTNNSNEPQDSINKY